MTSGTIEVNSVGLYYEVAGTGPPIVLLHDGLLDCRVWDNHEISEILESGVPAAGHVLNLERLEEFNRLTLDFLSRTPR